MSEPDPGERHADARDEVAPAPDPPHRPPARAPAPVPGVVHDVLKWAETVAAPIGVTTGLLLFFGWTYSRAYFGHFGIDQRLLQYSVQDQMLLSADVMFGTAVLVLTVVLVLVGLDRLLTRLGRREDQVGRGARRTTPAAGFLLLGAGLLSALRLPQLPEVVPLRTAAVAFLAGAVILLVVGSRAGRRAGRAPLLVALLLATFWVTTLYAENEGRVIAMQIDDTPAHLPLVTLYSDTFLDLPGTAVEYAEAASPAGTPLYRYGGLRLLAHSAGRWFLITGRYEGYRSTVAIVGEGDARVDVARQNQE